MMTLSQRKISDLCEFHSLCIEVHRVTVLFSFSPLAGLFRVVF